MVNNVKTRVKQYYFVGIGGISMSALAKLMLHNHQIVMGSDTHKSKITDELESLGATIFLGHKSRNINMEIDLVIFTGAIDSKNVELIKAKKLGIECVERSIFLGRVSSTYNKVIAIAGTHGKTTTTALIGKILLDAKLNPTIHLGGECNDLGGNLHIGGNDIFVTEACEYRDSFLTLKPHIAVITNVEKDHLDYYKKFSNIKNSFKTFAQISDICVTPQNLTYINNTTTTFVRVGTYFDYYAFDTQFHKNHYTFKVIERNNFLGTFTLNIPGIYNVENAMYSIIVARLLGISYVSIYNSLKDFSGVKRRYEKVGNIGNIPVIVDYAHHPTQIVKSISSTSQMYHNICCVFQPHTYSRTKTLWREFVKAYKGTKHLIIYPTFAAREKLIKGATAVDLEKCIKLKNGTVEYVPNQTKLYSKLQRYISDCDVILVLGAGNICDIVTNMVQNKNKSCESVDY